MGLADRVYGLAKGYIDKASQRWDELDEKAREELDGYLAKPEVSAFERAQRKIDAASSASQQSGTSRQAPFRDTLNDLPPGYEPPIPQVTPPNQPSTVDAAYRVLGVPPGSDFASVKMAYDTLRERTAHVKVRPGSAQQEQARRIERRAMAAYMLLAQNLKPDDDRFDRLEL